MHRAWVTVWVVFLGLVASASTGRSSDPHAIDHDKNIQASEYPSPELPDLAVGQADTNKLSGTKRGGRMSEPIIELPESGWPIIEAAIDQTTATIDSDIPGHPLSPEDFENSETMLFEQPNLDQQVDPIELAGKFEGDIVIGDPQELKKLTKGRMGSSPGGRDVEQDNEVLDMAVVDPSTKPSTRNAILNLEKRWPAGVIPYVISSSYRQEQRATIARAISKYHEKTCIRFVPRTVEKDYIHILQGDGCSSSVGRRGGAQAVSLGLGCIYVGIVMHELMHAAGFWHEQSRQDRDKFITINWFNIQDGMKFNFEKYNWEKIQSLGVKYDASSIMHYGPYAFAKDRSKPTIIPRTSTSEIGQRRGFTKTDALKINKLYSCAGTTGGVVEPTTTPQPITTTPPGHCADNNQYCSTWSDLGECEKNPTWMNVNCKKSCRQCGKECQDQNTYCNYWKERGECTKNAEYMGLFCKKSCESCHTLDEASSNVCEDKNRHCAAWGDMGQCRANPTYMMIYCKMACNNCLVVDEPLGLKLIGNNQTVVSFK